MVPICHIDFINLGWLEDAAVFAAIDSTIDTFGWNEWPVPLKNRHLGALEETYHSHKDYVCTLHFPLKTLRLLDSNLWFIMSDFLDADRKIYRPTIFISEAMAESSKLCKKTGN